MEQENKRDTCFFTSILSLNVVGVYLLASENSGVLGTTLITLSTVLGLLWNAPVIHQVTDEDSDHED
jgi:hypothetical protein